jgi:hypothetical protein
MFIVMGSIYGKYILDASHTMVRLIKPSICFTRCILNQIPAFASPGLQPIQVVAAVAIRDERPALPQRCPAAYRQLVLNCWASDPDTRPSFEEILARLQTLGDEEEEEGGGQGLLGFAGGLMPAKGWP